MKKIEDLRGSVVSPAAPAAQGWKETLEAQLQSQLPQPGKIYMLDSERKQLEQLGWKEGQPVPENLQAVYQEMEKWLRKDAEESIPKPNTEFQMPKIYSLEDLPKDKQEEILKKLKSETKSSESFPWEVPGAGPGVNEAIRLGLSESSMSSSSSPSLPPEEVSSENSKVTAGGNLQDAYKDIEVTEDDLYRYKVALLADQRFTKTYSFLNGELQVTFRELTAKESDMAFRQVVLETMARLDKSQQEPKDFWRNLLGYRLAMGIESVWSKAHGKIEIAEVEKMQVDDKSCPPPNTKVYALLPVVTQSVMRSESRRRLFAAAFQKFQMLVEKLELLAQDPDFFSKTQ